MTIKNLILAALMGVLVALTSGQAHSMHHEKGEAKKVDKTFQRKKLDDKVRAQLIAVYEANEKLHAAFFTYDAAAVEKNAVELRNLLLKITQKDLKKHFKRTLVQLEKITKDQNQEKNNHQYNLVSKKLVQALGLYDLGDTYNVYSCPMVKKVWVQNSKKMDKVHNPYASYMPHCGTKDTNF